VARKPGIWLEHRQFWLILQNKSMTIQLVPWEYLLYKKMINQMERGKLEENNGLLLLILSSGQALYVLVKLIFYDGKQPE
jgi:hypothetical protein